MSWFPNPWKFFTKEKESASKAQPKRKATTLQTKQKQGESKFINILLLGGTGVGKSTFINAFANYLIHGGYNVARNKQMKILIPMKITMDRDVFVIGQDKNEAEETGASSTQDVKSYTFPFQGGHKLRVIDTPGLADTRGLDQDERNCEYILNYISTFEYLNAICLVMRSDVARITVEFEYCIRQILTRLEKSATQNIIFIITNSRGRNYGPGETLGCLKRFVNDIGKASNNNINIPLDQNKNVFCVDNEGFKNLVALENDIRYPGLESQFVTSWNKSSASCSKMIDYIIGGNNSQPLKPHQVQNTVSINEARRLVVQLSQPLAEIGQLVAHNVESLKKHEEKLQDENQSLEELKSKIYIPHINIKATELTQPITVCASDRCASIVKIEEREMWNYKQKCHNPCYLKNVGKEIVGDPNLVSCWAMNGKSQCRLCECSYKDHMHIYYDSEFFDDKIEDKNAVEFISTKEEALEAAKKTVQDIKQRTKEYEDEQEIISNTTALFVHFLQHNAITPFDDSYKSYINHLIKREEMRGSSKNEHTIANLKNLLKKHEENKAAYDRTLQQVKDKAGNYNGTASVTPETILGSIKKLFHLKHFGAKIKDINDKQKKSLESEYKNINVDYIHPEVVSKPKTEQPTSLIYVNF